MRGDHDDAVAVAEDDVAGKHRRVAAADRDVDLDRLMQRQIGRRARAVVIGGEAELGDLGRIAKAAIGDDAGDAALHQPRHQDGAGGGGAGILAAVHHQHRAGRAILDRLALRMGAVAKHVDLVEVLARRHVAQREGLADQCRLVGPSGCTSWIIWMRKPRLNSAVATVAVETVFSLLRVASLSFDICSFQFPRNDGGQ